MSSPTLRRGRAALLMALASVALPFGARDAVAQQPVRVGGTVQLSLDDALRIAGQQNQAIEVARAGVNRAEGQRVQARSQQLPQLSAQAGYGRTLQSQFSGFSSTVEPDTAPKPVASSSLCTPFVPSTATAAERAAALAQAATCPVASGSTGGFDLSKTSFGAKNQYQLGLAFSQNVYTGGRIRAQNDAAEAQLRSANIEVAAQRAQVAFDVTSAYYDAVLADQLVAIADSALAETEAVLAHTRVARQVGNASEFELLRATVTRDNQLPGRIQARLNVQLTHLRLKQLLNMRLDDSVVLTTRIESPSGPSLPSLAANAPDTSAVVRAPVRQFDEVVNAAEAQVRIAKSQRIPSLSIVSNYQRLYFPTNVFPNLSAGVNNWTLGLSTNFPILDGGRIKGDVAVAQAGLQQARAQRDQAKEFASFDARVALGLLAEAEAVFAASRGTADQAQRAYAIDQVRYQEGISTQTDLSQSRLLLEQARTNRAQAARDLAVARVRLALIKDLPLQLSGTPAAQQQQQQQQQRQQTQAQQQQNAAARGQTGSPQP
jgi:outer membrane protein